LRFAKESLWTKRSPLFISLKFDTSFFHQTLPTVELNVTQGKEEEGVQVSLLFFFLFFLFPPSDCKSWFVLKKSFLGANRLEGL
jgi:hypothetical protein